MKHYSYDVNNLNNLQSILNSTEIASQVKTAKSILVQIYCAENNPDWINALNQAIENSLAKAIVVGATTVGEIANGHSLTGKTVIGFSFFTQSQLSATALNCQPGQEMQLGNTISAFTAFVNQISSDVKALLLLTTPLTLNVTNLLNAIKLSNDHIAIFGGGAGDYTAMNNAMVFKGAEFFAQGCVVVVFSGDALEIETSNYLGWRPLSKSMTITGLEGLWVTHIDDKPAFDVYKTYLDIPNDPHFFLNALEFPFLFSRNQQIIARVPIAVDERGALQFIADIKPNETFRLGYGDPNSILHQAKTIQQHMLNFSPEAIFIYSCGCRRFLMQEDVELETLPFQTIAPSFGFYTYGEYSAQATPLELLNSSLVAVGIREGPTIKQSTLMPNNDNTTVTSALNDPYANSHARIISRLIKFIGAVTQEFEQTNTELLKVNAVEVEKQHQLRDELIRFITMLGHEIRTPLAIIDSIIQSLEFEIQEDQTSVTIGYQRIRQAINRLNNLVSDVLVKERFGSDNRLLLRIENWQVYDLIDAVLSRFGLSLPDDLVSGTCTLPIYFNTLSSKKLIINCSNYQTLGCGDLAILQIVLNNLLENAYKYGAPTTDITLIIEAVKDSYLRFIVSNQVENFYVTDINALFEKYWRGSEIYNVAGAGLGLYLTKHLIAQHCGTIKVDLYDDWISFDCVFQ